MGTKAPPEAFGLTASGRRHALVAAGALLSLVLLGWLALARIGSLPGDPQTLRSFSGGDPTGSALDLVTFFGDLAKPGVAAPTVLLIAAVVVENLGARAALLTVSAALGAALLNGVVRALLGPTPDGRLAFGGYASYPSGHVTYATALFGALAWLGGKAGRRDVPLVCGLLIVLIGPARVYGQAHLPSDVLAGYALGLGWLLVVLAVLAPRRTVAGPPVLGNERNSTPARRPVAPPHSLPPGD